MAASVATDVEAFEGIALLALVAVIGYYAYQFVQGLGSGLSNTTNPNSLLGNVGRALYLNNTATNGQPQCTASDMSNNNCLDSNGLPCSWWDYFTGYTCFQGKAQANPIVGALPADIGGGAGGSF